MNRPTGYVTRGLAERICFGDIWLRPCDSTWVEVGSAMVGAPVGDNAIACLGIAYESWEYGYRQKRFDKLRASE